MRVYVAGPISGWVDKNRVAFENAKTRLIALGHDAVTPFDHEQGDDFTWEQYMKLGITLMLTCDGVCMLSQWHTSTGASLEHRIAMALKMDVREEAEWLDPTGARI